MWSLYRIVENAAPIETEQYLIHETLSILKNMDTGSFKRALAVGYGDDFYIGRSPIELTTMFVQMLKESKLVYFIEFIRRIKES